MMAGSAERSNGDPRRHAARQPSAAHRMVGLLPSAVRRPPCDRETGRPGNATDQRNQHAGRQTMAKGQQRSNKEKKKPKQSEKPSGPVAPFGAPKGK
jgi:hypothetical protein